MTDHVRVFHGPGRPAFDFGKPFINDKPLFCICGFSTDSGNKMGKESKKFVF